MFWKRKSKEPEEFSFQTLSDEEKEKIVRCMKDEFKELIETGGKVEKAFENLQWMKIWDGDEITISYELKWNLPVIRGIIRSMRC